VGPRRLGPVGAPPGPRSSHRAPPFLAPTPRPNHQAHPSLGWRSCARPRRSPPTRAPTRALLDPTPGRDDPGAVDACVEFVPDLCTPCGVATALSLLRQWHPARDPYALLRADPTLLVNQDESDLAADPSYGEVTSAG